MDTDADRPEEERARAELQEFLLFLGSALTAAGEAVNEIEDHLHAVAAAYGAPDARLVVLPTFVVVSLDPGRPATLEPTRQLRGGLRLDQTSAVWAVLKSARGGDIDPAEGSLRVLEAVALEPRFGRVTTALGHGLMAAGICFLLRPAPDAVTLAFVFGVAVGALRVGGRHWGRVQTILPAVAAFAVTAITFAFAKQGWADADLPAMIAPLVTFLPGAALTMGVVELSAGQIVTGATRLVSGALQLLVLAFGIAAAAQAVGIPSAGAVADLATRELGWWAPYLGVVIYAVGVWLYDSAPRGSLPGLFLVLLVAFVGQQVGNAAFGGYLGGFVGAFVMTPAARLVERTRAGPPALVSFLPAFWLLVPGALGLIGVTEYLQTDPVVGVRDFVSTLGSMVAIALGVLCAYPLVDTLERVRRPGP
ncbi:MAG TPA: threonine/serine exporter family protein [Acidimicrobiales bacterium]|nr:threonine/serine exporter family protein [Acidimicrobiales bacterium]